jgi:glycerol-3-phosphate cytidylyltransferase
MADDIRDHWCIGFTCGTFDLFHAGHVAMLRDAHSVCDNLIVGLQIDPTVDKDSGLGGLKFKSDRSGKEKPIMSTVERYLLLKGCQYVDEIIPYITEEELYELLTSVPIDVKIMGADYIGKDFTGKDLEGRLFDVYYNPRHHGYSTTKLREKLRGKN